MIAAGTVFENPRNGARMEFREWTPEAVVFDRLYKPGTGRADPHVHFDITQDWEVLSGSARAVLDGEQRELTAGESLDVPLGVPHQDVHNPGAEDALVRWRVQPANEFVESFADAFTHLFSEGKLNDQDEFPMLALFVVLRATRAQSFAANIPRPLQRIVLPIGAFIGRRRGYRARYS